MEWNRYLSEALPPNNQRVMISDGEVIAIAQYVRSDNHLNWIFDNESFKDMRIEWWAVLPTLPMKIV